MESETTIVVQPLYFEYNSADTIVEGWADYFQQLATPVENKNFDENFKIMVPDDVTILSSLFEQTSQPLSPVTEDEIKKFVMSFKNGKSPDGQNVSIEHIKYGGDSLIP